MWDSKRIDALWAEVRSLEPGAGLLALGRFACGRPCYLVQDGQGLRKTADLSVPLYDGTGQDQGQAVTIWKDRALSALGLEVVATGKPAQGEVSARAMIGVLLFRAALLTRILDLAFAHLTPRESGGQKTLQHQLVKANFTECFTLAERIRLESARHLEAASGLDLATAHAELSIATSKAAKLMGGHGYLLGSLHALETLSLAMASLFSPLAHARHAA